MNLQRLYSRLVNLAVVIFSMGLVILGSAESSVAYSIDYGMDQARGEKTIEYYGESYGESLRDIIEQTLRNNVESPDSKATAENTYKRESFLNDWLPKKRSSAFSRQDLMKLRETKNPRDRPK
ncbi:MAG: hypothetical protein DCF15_15080 [Phormidesmis priestleyi]|uniref:Uncharacterized protein n=1 Tax=Phormidesmis priestleyi TaxID=268141 RepID=A0A2W4X2Q0_9CYAN|nr:MAG: hypothetical protein DCF15_15080 [Phormidesmis priestleyi]